MADATDPSQSARERRERIERLGAEVQAALRAEEGVGRALERVEAIQQLREAVGDENPAVAAFLERQKAETIARSPLGADPAIMDPADRLAILTGGRSVELQRVARGGSPAADEAGGGSVKGAVSVDSPFEIVVIDSQAGRVDGAPAGALSRRRPQKARTGRPVGSGTWRDADHFTLSMGMVIREVEAQTGRNGKEATQEDVLNALSDLPEFRNIRGALDPRRLRDWMHRAGFHEGWAAFRAVARARALAEEAKGPKTGG